MNHPQRLLLAASLLLTATLAQAQTTVLKADDLPYIEVSGTAEKEVVPDEIYLRIVIRERYAGKTKVTLEEQEEKLRNLVKTLGIPPANLYLADANADYVKVRWQKKDVLTQKDYTLKVTDAATVGRVFQELEKLEITDAAVGRVSHSQLESLRREVKIAAIKAARDKAEYLLTAIGEHAGKPLEVQEQEVRPSYGFGAAESNTVSTGLRYQSAGSSANDDELKFQKVRIQSTIYVKFAIK
jgi:uncharacterized protein